MNAFVQKKLAEQLVTPEKLSPDFTAACQCTPNKKLLDQELEYLWDDGAATGKSYEVYLGKISRNPIIKSKITGKYFALPWSVIIKLAVDKGIDESGTGPEIPGQSPASPAAPQPDKNFTTQSEQ
jgi:hypothetical protein